MMLSSSDDAIAFLVPHSFTPRRQPRLRRLAGRAALVVFAILVACGPVAADPLPSLRPDPLLHVPANVQASMSLLQLLSRIARVSPTFRAQCERISRTPGLVVRMRYAGLRDDRPFNARTTVRRHQYGAMIAEVNLYVPLDPVEIVAHEFEHLVEQIQGADLKRLARVRGSGVMEIRRGEFETERAVRAGRRVLTEYGDADRDAVAPDPGTGGQ